MRDTDRGSRVADAFTLAFIVIQASFRSAQLLVTNVFPIVPSDMGMRYWALVVLLFHQVPSLLGITIKGR